MREYQYPIGENAEGMAVGDYLRRREGYSARTLVQLKHHALGLRVNGAHARTVDILHAGDELRVALAEEGKAVRPSSRTVEILFEDDDIIIYNKPPAMPCHTSCGHALDTLENVHAAHCLRVGAAPRLRAINRLDSDTSGCVLVARNQFVASRLKGSLEKAYCAIVAGRVGTGGCVEAPIYRPDPVDMRRVVDARGQAAATEYRVLCAGDDCSFLEFRLRTGRTHQIRVHMAHIGHPVLGDALYGTASPLIARQALHCRTLCFTHPVTRGAMRADAPLPGDMAAALAAVGAGAIWVQEGIVCV